MDSTQTFVGGKNDGKVMSVTSIDCVDANADLDADNDDSSDS
jgi:hypothetical protein